MAREELCRLGHETTLSYLAEVASLVMEETGLLPHVNPGLLDAGDIAALRKVSVSQGIMLESAAERLCERGGPHHGSPDKAPAARLATIRLAGEAGVPFTSGILIGIGETRAERIEALLALRELHDRYGHIQEIIVQNFRPKSGTRMAEAPAPSLAEHLWTIAVARLLFEPAMNIQAPPNLSPGSLRSLIDAGINDWGGVSPVTPDHVNPEAPWPQLDRARETRRNPRARSSSSDWRSILPMCGRWSAGSIRDCARRSCIASTAMGFPAPTTGRRASQDDPPAVGACVDSRVSLRCPAQ